MTLNISDDVVSNVLIQYLDPIDGIELAQSGVSSLQTDDFMKRWKFELKRKTLKGRITEFIKRIKMLCEHCHKVCGKNRTFIPDSVRLCDKCKTLPMYKMICKTTAVKQYKVKADKLDEIPSIYVENPYYRCAHDMQLFRLSDVLNITQL